MQFLESSTLKMLYCWSFLICCPPNVRLHFELPLWTWTKKSNTTLMSKSSGFHTHSEEKNYRKATEDYLLLTFACWSNGNLDWTRHYPLTRGDQTSVEICVIMGTEKPCRLGQNIPKIGIQQDMQCIRWLNFIFTAICL